MVLVTRTDLESWAPGQSAARTVEIVNAAAFKIGAPYAFKAVAFDALALPNVWEMNPSLVQVIRDNPGVLRGA